MSPRSPAAADVDTYIAGFPAGVRERLDQVRAAIRRALPDATEVISYQIPTFRLRTNVVHFAAYSSHISLYPAPFGVPEFEADLATYGAGKGTLRFPNDVPLPLDLIERVARYRAAEHDARDAAKGAGKPPSRSPAGPPRTTRPTSRASAPTIRKATP